ncbi:MAG: beta-galactosidase [Anaerolineae bacterium]
MPDQTSQTVFAADFPYFRLAREKWELMLTRLIQMGVTNLIVTVPWGFHETERSLVDLTSSTNPRRDLTGLLKLCAALQLTCLLKLGPRTQAGVLADGLPLWLLRATDLEAALPEAAVGWLKTARKTLLAYQAPAGPITALQIEAETARPPRLSEELVEVKWPIWLRKHYSGIDALNAAYGTAYRTVSEIKFPVDWSSGDTPLQRDAQTFLAQVQAETHTDYQHGLREAGWQIPIHLSAADIPGQTIVLTNPSERATLTAADTATGFQLQQAIEVDPDPPDVGRGTVWAAGAPIRADGSVRPTFWAVRQAAWSHTLPQTQLVDQTLVAAFPGSAIITRAGDTLLKIDLPARAKTKIYRLRLNGELVAEDSLKAGRGKLAGQYRAADDTTQTDLVLIVNDPTAPLSEFPLRYLSTLLAAQAQTLTRCAELAATLGQSLAPAPVGQVPSARPAHSSYTLESARRGLREADAALRKALASISALESGFATILNKEISAQPATPPLVFTSDSFEGPAREVMVEVGAACAKIGPLLRGAADSLPGPLAASPGLTIETYQQSYSRAVEAAQAASAVLVEVLALLRLEIASETLPLVAWRVHNTVQEIVESLRWGVIGEA